MNRIYTDGGFSIPRNIGAWALVVVEGNKNIFEERGEVKDSTSNRCEMLAFLRALEIAEQHNVKQINSDSQYVVKGFNSWMKGWERGGWVNSTGNDVKNQDLWKKIWEYRKLDINVKWVKGHNGNKWNEYVDGLTKV